MSDLPIDAWSGSDAELMAEQRAERWRLRYEGALEVDAYLRKELKAAQAKLARVEDALENPEDGLVNTCDHMPWVILGGVCQCGAIRHALSEETPR